MHLVSRINSLWPTDAIWRHKSRSTLGQVTAYFFFLCKGFSPDGTNVDIINRVIWRPEDVRSVMHPTFMQKWYNRHQIQ